MNRSNNRRSQGFENSLYAVLCVAMMSFAPAVADAQEAEQGPTSAWGELMRYRTFTERVFACGGRRYVISSSNFRNIDNEPISHERLTTIRVDGLSYSRNIRQISEWLDKLIGWGDVRIACGDEGFALQVNGVRADEGPQHDRPWEDEAKYEWRTVVWRGYDVVDMFVTETP